MFTFKISGKGLKPMTVEASSFDEAIAKCREIDPSYAQGQVKEDNVASFDMAEAREMIKDLKVQEEIRNILNGGDAE